MLDTATQQDKKSSKSSHESQRPICSRGQESHKHAKLQATVHTEDLVQTLVGLCLLLQSL